MKFLKLEKISDGKYLKKYDLVYLNKTGNEKHYEIATRKDLQSPEDLGRHINGVSIVAILDGKLVLLHEFRMAINKRIYNLIAGILEEGETVEACIVREVYEETGLIVSKINKILPPAYAAVGISDTKTCTAFVEVKGEPVDFYTSENEDIGVHAYTKEEVRSLLEVEEFSSRAQLFSYMWTMEIPAQS